MEKFKLGLALFFPAFTACLYFMGMRYYHAYFEFWNLDSEMFPVDVAEAMTYGVFIISNLTAKHAVSFLVWGIAVFFAIYLMSFVADYIDRLLIRRGIIPSKADNHGNHSNDSTPEPILKRQKDREFFIHTFGLLIFACLALVLFASLVYGTNDFAKSFGVKIAEDDRRKFSLLLSKKENNEKEEFSKVQTFHLKGGKKFNAIPISCSNVLCAVYISKGERLVLKISDIEMISATYSQ